MKLMTTDYVSDIYEKKFRLNENIGISKARARFRCAWCRSFIEEGDWSFRLSDVTSQGGRWVGLGQGCRIHLHCIEVLTDKLLKLKQDNVKKLTLLKLK